MHIRIAHEKTYKKIIAITADYLGPAAERFVYRQIEHHIKKDPKNLTNADLVDLIEWLAVSLAFLTEDKHMLKEYRERLIEIIPPNNKKNHASNKKRNNQA